MLAYPIELTAPVHRTQWRLWQGTSRGVSTHNSSSEDISAHNNASHYNALTFGGFELLHNSVTDILKISPYHNSTKHLVLITSAKHFVKRATELFVQPSIDDATTSGFRVLWPWHSQLRWNSFHLNIDDFQICGNIKYFIPWGKIKVTYPLMVK
jgi:hypothetical protein